IQEYDEFARGPFNALVAACGRSLPRPGPHQAFEPGIPGAESCDLQACVRRFVIDDEAFPVCECLLPPGAQASRQQVSWIVDRNNDRHEGHANPATGVLYVLSLQQSLASRAAARAGRLARSATRSPRRP